MAPKAKKEGLASSKAKAKALKAKKAELKGIHSHKKKRSTRHLLKAQDTVAQKVAQVSSEEHPQEKQA